MNVDIIAPALRDFLKLTWCTVEFTKKDGSKRAMVCTLNWDLIPDEFKPKKTEAATEFEVEKKVNNTNINVYEMNVGWRSIRVDGIIEIKVMFND